MADETPDLLLSPTEIQAGINEQLPTGTLATVAQQVTDAVREYCGWRIAKPADETFTLSGRRDCSLFLPTLHINSVTSVTDTGTALVVGTDFDWEPYGLIERLGYGCWARGRRGVVLVVNHGFTRCPGGIAEAITAAVGRAEIAPIGGIVSVGLPTSNVVFSRASAGGPAAGSLFLPHELAVLDQFRVPKSR